MWLGQNRECKQKLYGIKWPCEPIKILGVYFSYDCKAAENYNFVTKLEKLSRQLHWWKARDLSLIGKVLLLKTIGISQFMFLANVIHVPEHVIKKVNTCMYEFLWGTKCDKVKRDIVIQDYESGGILMCDFENCVKACKIKWIKAYLTGNALAKWIHTFEYLCGKANLSLFLQSNFELNELGELPLYYFDCVKYWRQMKCEFVISKVDLNNQFCGII